MSTMPRRKRVPEDNRSSSPLLPDIPAPPNSVLNAPTLASRAVPTGLSIQSDSVPSVIEEASPLTTPLATTTPTSLIPIIAAPPTGYSSPSSSASASHGHGLSVLKVIAIVVPIIAVLLLLPLLFLLFRSHQLRKASENRASQRISREAMLQSRASLGVDGRPRTGPLRTRPRRSPRIGTPRPANSLGLFNFDLSPPHSPTSPSPIGSRNSKVFDSLRSELSRFSRYDINSPPLRQSHAARSSKHASSLLSPTASRPESQEAHFAPLNRIGTTHFRSDRSPNSRGRSPLGARSPGDDRSPRRVQSPASISNPPRAQDKPQRSPLASSQLQVPSDEYGRVPRGRPPPSPPRHLAQVIDSGSKPRIPSPAYGQAPYRPKMGIGLDLGDRFTISDYALDDPPRQGLPIDPTWGNEEPDHPRSRNSPHVSPMRGRPTRPR